MTTSDVGSASAAFDLMSLDERIADVRRKLELIQRGLPPLPPRPVACSWCGMAGGAHWGDCPSRAERLTLPEARQIQRIKTSYKGQGIKGIAHAEWRAPSKATLPARNLRLPDGRLLVYQGPESIGGCPCGWWITADGFKVCASVDPTRWGNTLHLSMSYADRDPDWEDILQVRYTFYPVTIDVMMVLPRDGDYVNVHQHTFQIRPTPEPWNDAQPIRKQGGKVGTIKSTSKAGSTSRGQSTQAQASKASTPRDMGLTAGRRK